MTQIQKSGDMITTVHGMLGGLHKSMEAAATQYLTPKRACSLALQHLRRTPELAKCSPQSMVDAVMRCVELGLEPGAADLVYFLPFKGQVVFVPSYRGLVWLATRSGRALDVTARVVREGDTFDYDYGLNETLSHKIIGDSTRKITYAYAIAILSNGYKKFVVLDYPELMRHKEMSPSKSKSVWILHEAAMCEKTCIRVLFKTIGGSPELNTAVQLDELASIGKDQPSPLNESDDLLPILDSPTDLAPPETLEDLTPKEEKPIGQATNEQVETLKEVQASREKITKLFGNIPEEKQKKFLENCNLKSTHEVDSITKVKELQSLHDALLSA